MGKSVARGRRWLLCVALLAALGLAPRAGLQGAEQSLASLVPADAGFFLEINDFASHWSDFDDSVLFHRLQKYPPVAAWNAKNGDQLHLLTLKLAERLDIEPDLLLERLLGRRAAFAVWPRTNETEIDLGLLLLEAHDEEFLKRVFREVMGKRHRGKSHNRHRLEHAGHRYCVLPIHRDGQHMRIYLATLGKIGVVAGTEAIMKQVLDLYAGGETAPASLADADHYRAALARLRPAAAMTIFVNPRSWTELMTVKLEGDGESRYIQQALVDAWQAGQYWITSIEPMPHLAIDSFFKIDPERLSSPMRSMLSSLGGEAEALNRVPQNAMFAYAGRIDLGQLSRLLLSAGDESSMAQLDEMRDLLSGMLMGLDIFDDVLTSLGPDVVAFITPSDASPVGAAVGIRVRPREEGDARPEVSDALQGGLRNAMALATTFFNQRREGVREQEPARVVVEEIDGVKVTSLTGAQRFLPDEFVPSYGFLDDFFLFGTDPSALREMITVSPDASLAASGRMRELLGDRIATPSQLLYIDCAPFREFLKTHRGLVQASVAMTRGLDRDSTERSLDSLLQVLELAETIVIGAEIDESGFDFSIGLSTSPVEREEMKAVSVSGDANAAR